MKGFKDSSKTCYFKGGYAKGGSTKGAAKISQVMHEFKSGTLHSGSKKGPEVTNPKQAVAIARRASNPAGAGGDHSDARGFQSALRDDAKARARPSSSTSDTGVADSDTSRREPRQPTRPARPR
mgnify:CR=1 FL=1